MKRNENIFRPARRSYDMDTQILRGLKKKWEEQNNKFNDHNNKVTRMATREELGKALDRSVLNDTVKVMVMVSVRVMVRVSAMVRVRVKVRVMVMVKVMVKLSKQKALKPY